MFRFVGASSCENGLACTVDRYPGWLCQCPIICLTTAVEVGRDIDIIHSAGDLHFESLTSFLSFLFHRAEVVLVQYFEVRWSSHCSIFFILHHTIYDIRHIDFILPSKILVTDRRTNSPIATRRHVKTQATFGGQRVVGR